MADAKSASHPAKVSAPIDIRNPDLLQERILDFWGWVEKNVKVVAALFVVVLLGLIAWLALNFFQKYQEQKAQEAYYTVEAKYLKIREGFDRAKYRAMVPELSKDDKSAPQDKPATGDLARDYGTLLADLEKVAKDHAGTSAGAQAALLAGSTYLDYKEVDKAVEVTQAATKSLSEKNLTGSLTRVLLGNALAIKNDCAGAVQTWQKVLDNKSASFLHADVSLRAGLCFEKMNEVAKAEEMYRRVTSEGAESTAASTAKGLLRALEMKKASGSAAGKQG